MPPPSLITACDQLLTLPTDTSQDERMSHYHPLYISNLKLLLLTYSVLCLAIIWLSKANWNRLRTNSTLLATTKTFHYKTINKLITLSIPGLSCQSIFKFEFSCVLTSGVLGQSLFGVPVQRIKQLRWILFGYVENDQITSSFRRKKTKNINCLVRDKSRRGRWAVTQRSIIMSKELSFRTN